MKAMLLASPVEGYLACCEALSTLDQRELLPKIKSPTLVIAGRHDMATPISAGELIRSKHSRRQHDHPRRRPHFQCRAAARLHRRGGRLPDATLTATPSLRSAAKQSRLPPRRRSWIASRYARNDGGGQHGRPEAPRCRHERTPKSAGQCLGRQVDREPQRLQHRLPGHDHPLCLGRDLDPAAFRRAHAAGAGDRHHGRARAMGRIPPACARGARRGRLHARRHQGDPAAAGDLLRRAGGEPRRQGSRQRLCRSSACSRASAARRRGGSAGAWRGYRGAASGPSRSRSRWQRRAAATARWHAAGARPSRRPSRPSPCW